MMLFSYNPSIASNNLSVWARISMIKRTKIAHFIDIFRGGVERILCFYPLFSLFGHFITVFRRSDAKNSLKGTVKSDRISHATFIRNG